MNTKKRKIVSSIVAFTLACAILLTGTFAWQSISQTAKNEVQGFSNPGGRLHDDFNGKNKDVYVENFTEANQNGVPIFARVKLDEYMEVGAGAGTPSATGVKKIGKQDADIKDPSTWTTHLYGYFPESEGTNPDADIHDYWSLEMGGKTVFMPTFNKNKDSLKADINGTLAGPDKDPATNEDRYKDYKEYQVDEQKTDNAVYDADKNNVEEDSPVEGTNITTKEETHVAKETQTAQVITMDEWKTLDEPIGDYWVYDKDGWAYWAEPIMPGESTGLLLNGINLDKEPDDEWYYAINVVGQFATSGDWGSKDSQTGFYKDGITDDGLYLLDKVAERLPKIRHMAVKGGIKQYVKAGESLTLQVNMDIKNPTGNLAEKFVMWTSEPATSALVGNVFTPSNKMAGKTYKITATSGFDQTKTASVDVFVYPSDASGLVDGELDSKKYIDYGDNTFREVKSTGELGDFVCGGKDLKIGNVDDINHVEVLQQPDVKFGSKFLGPQEGNIYLAVGADGKLGTTDDVKVTGSPWPNNITDQLADEIIITTNENKDNVKVDKALQFKAEVKLKGKPIELQDVTWSVSGNSSSSTKINQNGVLTVGADEKHESKLNVTAVSKLVSTLKTHKVVTVKPWDLEDVPSVSPGSTTPVTIDGIEWYVLAKNGNEALLWAKHPILAGVAFDTSNSQVWENSSMRTKLNGEWLNSNPTLKEKAIQKDVSTRLADKDDEWKVTKDKVFLLTRADLTGQCYNTKKGYSTTLVSTSDPRDYSYGNSVLVTNSSMTKYTPDVEFTAYYDFLRSNYGTGTIDLHYYDDTMSTTSPNTANTSYGVRPAMWIKFGEQPVETRKK